MAKPGKKSEEGAVTETSHEEAADTQETVEIPDRLPRNLETMVERIVAKRMAELKDKPAEAPAIASQREKIEAHLKATLPASQFFLYETQTVARSYSLVPDANLGRNAKGLDERTHGLFVEFQKSPYPFGHNLKTPIGEKIQVWILDLALQDGVRVTEEDFELHHLSRERHRIKGGDYSLEEAIQYMREHRDFRAGLEMIGPGLVMDAEHYQVWLEGEYEQIWSVVERQRVRTERYKNLNRAQRAAGRLEPALA